MSAALPLNVEGYRHEGVNDLYQERLTAALRYEGVAFHAECVGGVLVVFKGRYYLLGDNGGEINVSLINHGVEVDSVPFVAEGKAVPVWTACYRIIYVLNGGSVNHIDYDFRMPVPDDLLD